MKNLNINSEKMMEPTKNLQADTDRQAAQTAQLLEAFRAGDQTAFSHLYDMYVNILYNYGYRLTNDKELLKDCIHDVFVKLYTKINDFGPIEKFKAYLFISLKNKICDEMRKRVNLSTTSIDDVEPIACDDIERQYVKQEHERIQKYKINCLLSQLSPRQCEALTLYYLEERKYEDICQIMSMNYQSVRNLMHRGLAKLRDIAK